MRAIIFSFFLPFRVRSRICFNYILRAYRKVLSRHFTMPEHVYSRMRKKIQWIISLEFDPIKFAFYRVELLLLLDLNRKAIGIVSVPSTSTQQLPTYLICIDCDTFRVQWIIRIRRISKLLQKKAFWKYQDFNFLWNDYIYWILWNSIFIFNMRVS